jgi:uncharacterized phage-associated protein
MATGAHTVANRFLQLAQDRGASLTPLQLMKLVYIAHGWMLGMHQRPLITDNIEAWKLGPVIPRLYRSVKGFGSGAVQGPLKEWFSREEPLDAIEDDVVQQTFDVYGGLSGVRLSALTHKPGTPWAKTWAPDSWAAQIPNDLISEHYKQLARERAQPVN